MLRFIGQFIKLNIAKNWRVLLIGAALVGLTALVTTCTNRGTKIVTLQGVIAKLDSLVSRKNDTLAIVRGQVVGLQNDTARLNKNLLKKDNALKDANAKLSAGELAAAYTDQAIEAGKRQVDYLSGQLSSYKLKEAAEAGLRKNNMGLTLLASDSAVNNRITRLTGYVQVYHDSTQSLKRVVGQQRETIRQQGEVITSQGEHISELEGITNKVRYTINEEFDTRKEQKNFLGMGQKKDNEALRKRLIDRVTPKPRTK